MSKKQHIRNTSIVVAFILIIFFRFLYIKQNSMLEFTSDITIVIALLAFSEIILSTLIHWPLLVISKAIHLIRSK